MSDKFPTYKDEFLYLTTTGRKSGQPREIEIWFVAHEGCYYLCAEGRDRANWVQNIRHDAHISFWVHGQRYAGTGRPLDQAGDQSLIQAVSVLFDAKYQWSAGLLVQLCPA